MPTKEDIIMKKMPVSSRYCESNGQEYFSYQNQGGLQRGRINARKFLPYLGESDRVLDFGCGGGSLLANLNCRQKVGVEINPTARSEAVANGIVVYENVEDVPAGSVNVIISNHALEHVLNPYEALRLLFNVLAPGGKIVLALPFDDWRTQPREDINDINHHLYTWSPLLIGNLLHEVGLVDISAFVYSHAWPPRYWQKLDILLPVWAFDLVCKYVAWRDNRRQVIAIGYKPKQ